MIVVLDNLRSIYNTASIFRTADAVGVGNIMLCGTTPTPVDKWGRSNLAFSKVSLGAELSIKWEYQSNINDGLDKLRTEGYTLIALEQSVNSVDIFTYNPPAKIALVVGPERTGMGAYVLNKCDTILEIPMFGKKESLNVSVAFGIAAYALHRSNK